MATGEVGELTVYEPHPFKVAELNPYQQGGTFSFIYVACINGYSDTANWETHITIPIDQNEYEEKFFCKSCRVQLKDYIQIGYALLDLRVPDSYTIIPINSAGNNLIRCYEIQTEIEPFEIEITVLGTLKIVEGFVQ